MIPCCRSTKSRIQFELNNRSFAEYVILDSTIRERLGQNAKDSFEFILPNRFFSGGKTNKAWHGTDRRRSKEVHQPSSNSWSWGRAAIAVVLNQPPTAHTDERGPKGD